MEKGIPILQLFKKTLFWIIRGVLGTLLLFHGGIAFMQEEFLPQEIKVIHLTRSFAELPEELSGLKIAFFADLHWQLGNEKKPLFQDLLRKLRSEAPDLILIGGDITDQFLKKVPLQEIEKSLVPFLKELHAPMGVFAVMGNHEAACGLQKYRTLLQAGGLRTLEGEKVFLPAPGNSRAALELTGIMEKKWFRPQEKLPEKWKNEEEKGKFTKIFPLYICHRPEVFDRLFLREKRPFLLLAAHYHGGLFALPFLQNGYFVNKRRKRHFAPYIYGNYQKGNGFLTVTSGFSGGYFSSRRRVNLPRELLIITLQKEGKK